MLCISAAYAVMRCPCSPVQTVTFVNSVKTNKQSSKFFHDPATKLPNHSNFSKPKVMAIFRRGPPNRGVECRWDRQKSRSQLISCSTACCKRFNCPSAIHSAATDHGKLMTLVTGKRRSLLMAGNDDRVFMTRNLNVMPNTTEQHLVVSRSTSED